MGNAPGQLAPFIQRNHARILQDWVEFARGQLPWAGSSSEETLRDHGDQLLNAVVADMQEPQTSDERSEKSKGHRAAGMVADAGRTHAAVRLHSGFTLAQLVAEYRALRASVLRLWAQSRGGEDRDIARFNEAIDATLSESVGRYSEVVESTREQFLAILGHDLRNPLSAVVMGASLLTKTEGLDDKQAQVATRIFDSGQRMSRLVRDLLDFARTRLGGDIPLSPRRLDLAELCRGVVAELEPIHARCVVRFDARGDLWGEWDGDRLSQAISNLVANALQYGCDHGTVEVAAFVEGDRLCVRIHNEGPAISREAQRELFSPMVRRRAPQANDKNPGGLGLGLFIAHQIVTAHGGTIDVASADGQGTTFTMRVPRRSPAVGANS